MNEFNISQENWDKIIDYARIAYDDYKSEIGGMATVIKDPEGNWHVEEPVILKQEISGANTSLDKDELAKYYTKTAMFMQEKWPKLDYRFLWWHSHHTMAAFWSGTDHKAIEEFSDGDMSFALVVNLKQEYKFRISIWKPIEVAQDVTLNILGKEPTKLSSKMIKEVEKLCEKETQVTYLHNSRVRNGAQGSLWNETIEEQDDEMEHVDQLMYAASYDPTLTKIIEEVDDACDKFIEGEVDLDAWHNRLSSMERKLSEMHYSWMIDVPSKGNAFEELLGLSGGIDLIKMRGQI